MQHLYVLLSLANLQENHSGITHLFILNLDAITALLHMDNVLYTEVLHHSSFCRERAATVIGQDALLQRVMGYLSRVHATKPFVIHGIGGSGKTSLIAKVFTKSLDQYQGVHVSR